MAYYSKQEMESILNDRPEYQRKLYCKGFLITDQDSLLLDSYPFYGNWSTQQLDRGEKYNLSIIVHKDADCYTYIDEEVIHFIIGHAYNPYSMEYLESDILQSLAKALKSGENEYWKKESELTGVFCIGYLKNGVLTFSTDCTGMQMVYYGCCGNHTYITSHSKLVADLCDLKQDDYIVRLVNSRFYKYWGTFLPGDRSPYSAIKRAIPNFAYKYYFDDGSFSFNRYYPTKTIDEINEEDYESTIFQIAEKLENSLKLISLKWPNQKAAVSVTGGRDSTTTLAAARKVYSDLRYFSYISNEAEKADAEAAHTICESLGLEHIIYQIPDECALYQDIEIFKRILECNAGCIGQNNLNDVKKRIYLDTVYDFDTEVKSWVDELSRGEAQNKYNTRRFPANPSPGYYRCMWKVIVNPRLIRESNAIFREYLDTYYDDMVLSYLPWTEYFYWEFSWSAGEGQFLTSEHKYTGEITIPYNNRTLLNTMLTVPLEKRLNSQIQKDVIRLLDKRIEDSRVYVKNLKHTDFWAFAIRTYLRIFSKV